MPDEDLATNRVESEDDQVNVLGDQDAENTAASYQYPADANVPTARNVRRYPELFEQEVIDSFNVTDANDELDTLDDAELDETTVDDGESSTFTSDGL